jgi:hypothetical protein
MKLDPELRKLCAWYPTLPQRTRKDWLAGRDARRMVMQRESPRALVHSLSGKTSGAHAPHGIFVLDKAFVLIEGHPALGFVVSQVPKCEGPGAPGNSSNSTENTR